MWSGTSNISFSRDSVGLMDSSQQGQMVYFPACLTLISSSSRVCLAMGYIPKTWQEAKVVFIPKRDYTAVKYLGL